MFEKELPTYSKRLIACREELKLSQNEVAEKLDIKQSTISKYETGVNVPSVKNMVNIADLYKKPITWLFFEKEYDVESYKGELNAGES